MQQYQDLNTPQRILLGPGPSNVEPRVLSAMSHPILGHLDPLFIQIMGQVQDMLRQVFQTKNNLTVPISGTGSAGMEAAISNLVEPDDSVLVCVNGYFGNRIVDMAQRYRANVQQLRSAMG